MIITLRNVVERLFSDYVIVQSYVYSYKSKKYWKIFNSITVELSNGSVITIPAGYYYDMASVPKWLWSIVRPFNDGLIAFLIHDYLYTHQNKHSLSRKQADGEMLIWLKTTNPNWLDNYTRYFFVRIFGWLWWKKIV